MAGGFGSEVCQQNCCQQDRWRLVHREASLLLAAAMGLFSGATHGA